MKEINEWISWLGFRLFGLVAKKKPAVVPSLAQADPAVRPTIERVDNPARQLARELEQMIVCIGERIGQRQGRRDSRLYAVRVHGNLTAYADYSSLACTAYIVTGGRKILLSDQEGAYLTEEIKDMRDAVKQIDRLYMDVVRQTTAAPEAQAPAAKEPVGTPVCA